MRKIARRLKEAIREWIADGIIQCHTAVQRAQIRGAGRTKRHSPGSFAELQIGWKVVDAAAGSDDCFVAYSVSNSHARSNQVEPLFSGALVGMLGGEHKIERPSNRLAIHRNALRCWINLGRIKGSNAVVALKPDAGDFPPDAIGQGQFWR